MTLDPSDDLFNPDSPNAPKISGVTRAFIELEKLEPKYQQLIGQIMLKVAESVKRKRKNDVQTTSRTKGLRELGAEKVVGLMKSQSRRRWYDQDKILHKVYQDLFILEQVGRPFLSDGMIRAIEHLNVYIKDCDENKRFEEMDKIVKIIDLALFDEDSNAENSIVEASKKSKTPDHSVGERSSGMRVENG